MRIIAALLYEVMVCNSCVEHAKTSRKGDVLLVSLGCFPLGRHEAQNPSPARLVRTKKIKALSYKYYLTPHSNPVNTTPCNAY